MLIPQQRSNPISYREMAAILNNDQGISQNVSARRPFQQSVWVYACVTLIAQSFCQIPVWLGKKSRRTGGRKRGFEQILSHPILDLLEQPNDLMTREVFFETMLTYLMTGGNVWIYIDEPTSMGLPRSLMVMSVYNVRPNKDPKTGRLLSWFIKIGPGKEQEVGLEDMIHIKLPTPYDPIMGLPPTAAMQAQLDADYARTIFDRAFFRNNASPDAVLIYRNGILSPDQRTQIRESWDEFHQGVEKAGGVAVIGGDFDFKVWGVSHSQSQFIENRSFTREEVASAYKTPVLLLNATRGGALTREALDASQVVFHEHAVFPNMRRFTTPFNIRIVRPYDPNLLFDFDIDALPVMTAYLQAKATVFDKLVKNGTPPNIAKDLLDINMDDIEGGDKGYLPGNYVPIDALQNAKVMAPPAATPNAAPGKRPPSPKQAGGGRAREISFSPEENFSLEAPTNNLLVHHLRGKLKGTLFRLRAETLRNDRIENPFNLVAAKRTWIRKVLPVAAASMQDTFERIDGQPGVVARLSALTYQEQEEAFRELDKFVEKISFASPSVMRELERLVARSTQVIDDAWTGLSSGREVGSIFRTLNGVSRLIAEDIVRWTRNAALFTRYPKESRHECGGASFRYPGDALASLEEVLECRHVTVLPELEVSEHHEEYVEA